MKMGWSMDQLSTTQTEFNATVTVTNSSSVNAYLYAWIDFDRNGRFDRDEFSANDVITIAAGSAGSTELLQWIQYVWTEQQH